MLMACFCDTGLSHTFMQFSTSGAACPVELNEQQLNELHATKSQAIVEPSLAGSNLDICMHVHKRRVPDSFTCQTLQTDCCCRHFFEVVSL